MGILNDEIYENLYYQNIKTIYVEGETEQKYFQKILKEIDIDIKVYSSDICSNLRKYGQILSVAFVFDSDTLQTKLKKIECNRNFDKYIQKIFLTNPDFEFWLVLHHEQCVLRNYKSRLDAVYQREIQCNYYQVNSKGNITKNIDESLYDINNLKTACDTSEKIYKHYHQHNTQIWYLNNRHACSNVHELISKLNQK